MYVLFRIIVKELLQLAQDRRMLPVLFLAPIVQIVVFGYAVNTDVTNVPLVLVDRDRSSESRELVRRFTGSGYFELVGFEEEIDGIEPWLVTGNAQLALVIGADYGKRLEAGGAPTVQVIADGTDSTSSTLALGYATAIVRGEQARIVLQRLARAGRMGLVPGRIDLVPRVWYNPDLLSRWFYVPAVLAMILMIMTMLLSAMAVVREKEIGTMEQLMVTPIHSWQLLVGKLFPFGLIGVVQVFLVSGVAVFGFGVPLRGSFWLLLGLTMLFLLNTLGLGLLVSTVVRTQQQAMMTAAFVFMVPMLYLSGLIFPIENMPHAIQVVTYAIPLRYYANVIRGIFLRGSGLDVLWPEAVTMAATGVAILALASLRFRKRVD
jgi:drug efflux transport system permease protein